MKHYTMSFAAGIEHKPEWTAKIRPELTVVPPCRDCGKVPVTYARFADGTVQCEGDSRRECYNRPVDAGTV